MPPVHGRATLATVAASAGVSIATASKVLNGRSDVSSTTRARVQDALRQHDYVGRRPEPVGRPRSGHGPSARRVRSAHGC